MRYFIDTNIFVFLHGAQDELEFKVRKILDDYNNQYIISAESVREILMLIKCDKFHSKGICSYDDIMVLLDEYRISVRYVDKNHLKKLGDLNPAPNHSDPADLMIIAQAITENIPIISSDTKFKFYIQQGLQLMYNNRSKR